MHQISTRASVSALVILALAGCTTNKEKLLTHGSATMLDVWAETTSSPTGAGSIYRQLLDARATLRRPLSDAEGAANRDRHLSYTRSAENEIDRQFRRLPNPDLVMYVFAHLSGTEAVPIPGYSTVFALYQRVHYALPGERTEDY